MGNISIANVHLDLGAGRRGVDMGPSAVRYAGLGQLVQVYATTSHLGGSLKLLNLTKRLRDLLVLTKLLTVFDTFDTEKEALGSFSG